MHLEKYTVKDIIFIAIIAAGYLISGFVTIPLIIGTGIYGSPYVIMAIFYAFFRESNRIKRKRGVRFALNPMPLFL